MDCHHLDKLSLQQLQSEAASYSLQIVNDRNKCVNLIMAHLERQGLHQNFCNSELLHLSWVTRKILRLRMPIK